MRFGSVCSGIEAASQAWRPLGWEPAFFSEIERFPCAVLAHHYPDVPNFGDMTNFEEWPDVSIDLLAGGTPCQSFSVAGLRRGLDDPRGDLMLTYLAIARRYRPRWLVWENVPGVLSSSGGRDFGALLRGLGELGYGFAWRVLDAQYVRTRRFARAVPQRRRRVWLVGYLGDWRRAAAVLFERESLSGHPPPRRETGQGVAARTVPSLTGSGRGVERVGESRGQDPVVEWPADCAPTLNAHYGDKWGLEDQHALNGAGLFTPVAIQERAVPTLRAMTHDGSQANAGGQVVVASSMAVRRLTPRECERLMGFPDDFTKIPYRDKPAEKCPDGPRYKALGNSWAVNCAEWIGERIAIVDALASQRDTEAAQ